MRTTVLICISIILLGILQSCKKADSNCMKGTVIGTIRSNGGGLAVSLDKKYKGSVKWQGHKNVIELLNIPVQYRSAGTTLYFSSREAKQNEQGIISADGDESLKTILYGEKFSTSGCP